MSIALKHWMKKLQCFSMVIIGIFPVVLIPYIWEAVYMLSSSTEKKHTSLYSRLWLWEETKNKWTQEREWKGRKRERSKKEEMKWAYVCRLQVRKLLYLKCTCCCCCSHLVKMNNQSSHLSKFMNEGSFLTKNLRPSIVGIIN